MSRHSGTRFKLIILSAIAVSSTGYFTYIDAKSTKTPTVVSSKKSNSVEVVPVAIDGFSKQLLLKRTVPIAQPKPQPRIIPIEKPKPIPQQPLEPTMKSQPKVVNPVKPKVVTPAKPKVVTPAKPKVVTPAKPKAVTPAQPKAVTPVKPKVVEPAKPKVVEPANPKVVAPQPVKEEVPLTKTYATNSLVFAGVSLKYYFTTSGYDTGAIQKIIDQGKISASITHFNPNDGNTTYFAAHNKGKYSTITKNLKVGSIVTVTDSDGSPHQYKMVEVIKVNKTGDTVFKTLNISAVELYMRGSGQESIALQYCVTDSSNMRVWYGVKLK